MRWSVFRNRKVQKRSLILLCLGALIFLTIRFSSQIGILALGLYFFANYLMFPSKVIAAAQNRHGDKLTVTFFRDVGRPYLTTIDLDSTYVKNDFHDEPIAGIQSVKVRADVNWTDENHLRIVIHTDSGGINEFAPTLQVGPIQIDYSLKKDL